MSEKQGGSDVRSNTTSALSAAAAGSDTAAAQSGARALVEQLAAMWSESRQRK